jgi:hypothetical protein
MAHLGDSRRPGFGASPYLRPEVLIDATRSTRKSQTSSGCRNGAMNPPLAASTWTGTSSLILVDHVLAEALVHQPVDLVLAPRGAERRQVLCSVAAQQKLGMDHGVGRPRVGLILGNAVLGSARSLSGVV